MSRTIDTDLGLDAIMNGSSAQMVEGERLPAVRAPEPRVRRIKRSGRATSDGRGQQLTVAGHDPAGCDATLEPLRREVVAAEAVVRDLIGGLERCTLQELRVLLQDVLPEAGSRVRSIAVWRLLVRGQVQLSDDGSSPGQERLRRGQVPHSCTGDRRLLPSQTIPAA
jgi:hypothetical protein